MIQRSLTILHSSSVSDCSTPPHRSLLRAHGRCRPHPFKVRTIHHTTQHTPHEQHTHGVRGISMHVLPFPSAAGKTLISLFFLFSACCTADLSSGWHADGSLLCACSALVSMSIHPPSAVFSSLECIVLLTAEKNPKTNREWFSFKKKHPVARFKPIKNSFKHV